MRERTVRRLSSVRGREDGEPRQTTLAEALMDNSRKVCLAAALAAGYVLGRTRKGRLAIAVASVVAGHQLPLSPRELAALGARKLAENPQFAPLVEQARTEVLEAGRTALSGTANRRLESFADALQQRTEALLEEPLEEGEEGEEEEGPESSSEAPEGEQEAEQEAGDAEAREDERPAARKKAPRRTAAARSSDQRRPGRSTSKKGAARTAHTKAGAADKSPQRKSRRR
ncbi:hypothetical protein [Streptomyces sp. NPDC058045]|uniref:hypothetical protein n=1 Tax=Streptomyces sp. NPDC058045 TaxID=3346311 RepID=UPI0036EED175